MTNKPEIMTTADCDPVADNQNAITADMTPIRFASMFGRTKAVDLFRPHGAFLKRRNRFRISASLMIRVAQLWQRFFQRHKTQDSSTTPELQSL
jgi:hypothetical protein